MSLVPCILCVFLTWPLTHGRPVYLFPLIKHLWRIHRSCWPGSIGVQDRCVLQMAVLIYLSTAIVLISGGSSTVSYTQTIHRTKNETEYPEKKIHNNKNT